MEINAQTQLCAVIGNPVEHSLSPAIHNAAFQTMGLNFVYVACRVEDLGGAVAGMRALGNLRGFSVTIPHKVAIVGMLDEVEATARHIGSVNTVVIEQGKLLGYNTDASGALRALDGAGVALDHERVVLLGSGGAARAIAFGLADRTKARSLTILGIDERERVALVRDLRAKTSLSIEEAHLDERRVRRALEDAQVLIHGTPVGMYPQVEQSVVPKDALHSGLAVMDIVYNPLETRLLREAREAGCKTVRGLEMFLNQAVDQFELWTGRAAPVDVMRAVLEVRFA